MLQVEKDSKIDVSQQKAWRICWDIVVYEARTGRRIGFGTVCGPFPFQGRDRMMDGDFPEGPEYPEGSDLIKELERIIANDK